MDPHQWREEIPPNRTTPDPRGRRDHLPPEREPKHATPAALASASTAPPAQKHAQPAELKAVVPALRAA